jgi:hypothetical protein
MKEISIMNKIIANVALLFSISCFIYANTFAADATSTPPTKPQPTTMTPDQRKAEFQRRAATWKKCNQKYHDQFSKGTDALTKQMRDLGVQEAAIMKKFRDANPQLKTFNDSLRKIYQKNAGHGKDSLMLAQRRKMIQDNPDLKKAMQAQGELIRNDPDLKKIRDQRRLLGKQIKEAKLAIVKGDAECEECFKK